MQVRCYACGTKIHNGMPTMKELSSDQLKVVRGHGCDEACEMLGCLGSLEVQNRTLDHPNFQGMSLNSFCPECQDLILGLPHDAWRHDIPGHQWSQDPRLPFGHPEHFTVVFRCTCGHEIGCSRATPEANRDFRKHLAKVLAGEE